MIVWIFLSPHISDVPSGAKTKLQTLTGNSFSPGLHSGFCEVNGSVLYSMTKELLPLEDWANSICRWRLKKVFWEPLKKLEIGLEVKNFLSSYLKWVFQIYLWQDRLRKLLKICAAYLDTHTQIDSLTCKTHQGIKYSVFIASKCKIWSHSSSGFRAPTFSANQGFA